MWPSTKLTLNAPFFLAYRDIDLILRTKEITSLITCGVDARAELFSDDKLSKAGEACNVLIVSVEAAVSLAAP